jgi:aminoglycoside 2'-N-acetyltransferase I
MRSGIGEADGKRGVSGFVVRGVGSANLTAAEALGLRGLCEQAFDGEYDDLDWDNAWGGWHVIVTRDDELVGHAAVVGRVLSAGTRELWVGYVESVATRPDVQRSGVGTTAMKAIGELIVEHFELGALSTGEHSFYARFGWERWLGPTYVRDGASLRRTADEDDGIMVLRFGPSELIDLSDRLVCEARMGDDW